MNIQKILDSNFDSIDVVNMYEYWLKCEKPITSDQQLYMTKLYLGYLKTLCQLDTWEAKIKPREMEAELYCMSVAEREPAAKNKFEYGVVVRDSKNRIKYRIVHNDYMENIAKVYRGFDKVYNEVPVAVSGKWIDIKHWFKNSNAI